MTSRYFCEEALLNPGDVVGLPAEESRHLLKTMRGRVGDRIIVFGGGVQYLAELSSIVEGRAMVKLSEPMAGPPRPSVAMAFAIPWIKGGKTEFLVQKLTELGAAEIVVFQARREIARGDESKLDRLTRVSVEACKQCERIDLPRVTTAGSLAAAVDTVPGVTPNCFYLLHERTEGLLSTAYSSLPGKPAKVFFASGPEGGWHDEELSGLRPEAVRVSLGTRILRAETAPLVAAAALLTLSGEI